MYLKIKAGLNFDRYSIAGQDVIIALSQAGIKVVPELSGIGAGLDVSRFNKLKKIAPSVNGDPYVKITIGMPEIALPDYQATYNIIWTDCETAEINKKWIDCCEKFDLIFVPSFFCKKAFLDSGLNKPIFVIPYPYDSQRFTRKTKKSTDIFKFLFFGTWKYSNGVRELIKAYFNSFIRNEKVSLHIFSPADEESIRKEIIELSTETGLDFDRLPNIEWKTGIIKHSDLPDFFSQFDCLVSPHYGKAFGLSIVNAMAVGLPIITTDFGGVQDYCRNNTARLIPCTMEKANNFLEGAWYKKEMTWGRPNNSILGKHMREIFENSKDISRIDAAQNYVLKKYRYESVVEKLKEVLIKISPEFELNA